MSTGGVGYYVHHHGSGHAARAGAIARRMKAPVTFLSSTEIGFEGCEVVHLPIDTDGVTDPARTPRELHYAPVDSPGLSQRMSLIADWIARARPSLFVVDVSVEVAMFVRLCGTRVVIVRQHGDRTDPPHVTAMNWAERLLAPFPHWFEDPTAPEDVRARTSYTGAISRFDGSARPAPAEGDAGGRLLVVAGGVAAIEALAEEVSLAAPGWEVEVIGTAGPERTSVSLSKLVKADVVLGAAGSNLVHECAFARRGLIVVPQERPFGEQANRARLLSSERMAVAIDNPAGVGDWAAQLDLARSRAAALSRLIDGEGAIRAAGMLDGWASEAQTASSTPSPGIHRTLPSSSSAASQSAAGQVPQRS